MAKEEKPYIIDPRLYKPDLEKKVQEYLALAEKFPHNDILYVRTSPPRFKSGYEKEIWETQEINRIVHGHNGLCGKMYFYFNYCFIQKITGGKIRPEFRVVDHEWFRRIENAQKTVGRGLIAVKRRRMGASWKEAADVIHDIIVNTHYTIGMNSKSEVDSKALFKKVRFIYDNLPHFLRPRLGSKTALTMEFFRNDKDEFGNMIRTGVQNEIVSKAPTVSAFEGFMLNKWVCDEAGKISENLLQMFAFTEDTMMDEYRRTGTPIIFGTVGEIDGAGAGLMILWKKAEDYGLDKFLIPGWAGIFVDEKGNDRVEEAIRWVVYEGETQKKRGNKAYTDFLQKYPLNERHAFELATDGGLGDTAAISLRRQELLSNPPKMKTGYFRWGIPENKEDAVVFVPEFGGDIKIFEDYDSSLKNGYVAGADPAPAIDNALSDTSDMSLIIRRRQVGLRKPKIALEYTARPKKGTEFFEQSIMACLYFGGTQVLVEKNVYDMISYFTQQGYQYLLFHEPQSGRKLIPNRPNSVGGRLTEAMKRYMESLIEVDLEENLEEVDSIRLLDELPVYGAANTDCVIAYGWSLIMEQELKKPTQVGDGDEGFKLKYKYIKVGNKIVRVERTPKASPHEHIPKDLQGTIVALN